MAPLQPPARGYVDDALLAPAGSLARPADNPAGQADGQAAPAHELDHRGLPTGCPAFDHIPTGPNCAACGLAPPIFLNFPFGVEQGSRLPVDSKAAHRQALPPTPWLIDRSRGPVRRRAHRGAAQGVWGRHALQPWSRPRRRAGRRGELMRPRWGALYGEGEPRRRRGEPRRGALGHQRTRYRAKCERLKNQQLKKGGYATAHCGTPRNSSLRRLKKICN